jgi:hypothetical protein
MRIVDAWDEGEGKEEVKGEGYEGESKEEENEMRTSDKSLMFRKVSFHEQLLVHFELLDANYRSSKSVVFLCHHLHRWSSACLNLQSYLVYNKLRNQI